tara:strand:+ start:586 stop:759 length:174 start_codon:yes stop_codon:yes gene_type:complete
MDDNYSIDEILSAVDDLRNLNKKKIKKVSKNSSSQSDKSSIPKNTLKLIEEAEKSKN